MNLLDNLAERTNYAGYVLPLVNIVVELDVQMKEPAAAGAGDLHGADYYLPAKGFGLANKHSHMLEGIH